MKIVKNEKLIKRNAQIGNYTLFIALAILAAGIGQQCLEIDEEITPPGTRPATVPCPRVRSR